jgi:hypothetical protein
VSITGGNSATIILSLVFFADRVDTNKSNKKRRFVNILTSDILLGLASWISHIYKDSDIRTVLLVGLLVLSIIKIVSG